MIVNVTMVEREIRMALKEYVERTYGVKIDTTNIVIQAKERCGWVPVEIQMNALCQVIVK